MPWSARLYLQMSRQKPGAFTLNKDFLFFLLPYLHKRPWLAGLPTLKYLKICLLFYRRNVYEGHIHPKNRIQGFWWRCRMFANEHFSDHFNPFYLIYWWSTNLSTLSLPNKVSSAWFLVCFNFQSASMMLKVCENVVWVSNSLDREWEVELLASHSDWSCLHTVLGLWLAGKVLNTY